MQQVWIYTLASVFIISLISFVGVLALAIEQKRLHKLLLYLVSFSAGALLGDVFIHLIPQLIKEDNFTLKTSFLALGGIVIFFTIEKIVHWQHCHMPQTKHHIHPFAIVNLVGDGVHNLIDGLIIGASYIVSIPLGIATTIAVIFHEIPQEIGDFGVLLHGGFSKNKALLFNFLSALAAVLGGLIALVAANASPAIISAIVPIAIGGFIYIAGADLIPELHKNFETKKAIFELIAFIAGILVIASLILIE